jgi:hypothetical protein
MLTIGATSVPVMLVNDFMAADARRPASFITNFGDWALEESAAGALGSPVTHLEWFHDTGELVAIGQVPHLGHGDIEISRAQEMVDVAGAAFGGAGGRIVRAADGAVREYFPAMVVDEGTRLAILRVVEHGPRVHELLWGWHLEHRKAGGWSWLTARLEADTADTGDTADTTGT